MQTVRMARPIYNSMKTKLETSLRPSFLEIIDDSQSHASHLPMQGKVAHETHFVLKVVSDSFDGKTLIQRHRMVNELLTSELNEGGVHALSLSTLTPTEYAKKMQSS